MVTLCGFGVSNYYNKLKLVLLEKGVAFSERVLYPWQCESFLEMSPMGRIPFLVTEQGGLSESQVILEYLEERFPARPLYPGDVFERARCREVIQHLELNVEWVARRLYKESFFGGEVSNETKTEVRMRLATGLEALAALVRFDPYICGPTFTAADCCAVVHFMMVRHTTVRIYGQDMLLASVPAAADYLQRMAARPSIVKVLADREQALATFAGLKVKYDG